MAMMGSRKPALRNKAANPEPGSSSRRAPTLGASAVAMARPLNRTNEAPSSASGFRYRYSPEAGVGILAAFVDPAAAHLRIAEPIRAGARGILEVTSDLCCTGYLTTPYRGRQKPFRIAEFMLSCNLCRHRIGGGPIYMYKGEMAFCKPECRYDYAMQKLYKERQRRAKAKGKAPEADDDEGEGLMFFTCAKIQ